MNNQKIKIPEYNSVSLPEKSIIYDLGSLVPPYKNSFLCDTVFSIKKGNWKGVPIYRTFNSGTCVPLISKVISFVNKGASDSNILTPYFPLARPNFVECSASEVINTYKRFTPQIFKSNTVVFGSAHRAGAYIACMLNAPFLPTKFQSYSQNWEHIIPLANWVAGFDLPADPLIYVWQYIANKIPEAYKKILSNIKNVVIVKSTNLTPMKKFFGGYLDLSVLKLAENFKHNKPLDLPPYAKNRLPPVLNRADQISWKDSKSMLRAQWEWNIERETINLLKDFCKNKKNINFTIISAEEVDLFSLVSNLAREWQIKNAIDSNRLIFNGYHISHPYYELITGGIPIISYTWAFKRRKDWILRFKKLTNLSKAETYMTTFGGDTEEDFGKWLEFEFDVIKKTWVNDDFNSSNTPCRLIAEILDNKNFQKSIIPMTIEELLYFTKEFQNDKSKIDLIP